MHLRLWAISRTFNIKDNSKYTYGYGQCQVHSIERRILNKLTVMGNYKYIDLEGKF